MIKKVFNLVIVVLVALVTFSSCNKTDYLTVIPQNATFVASADLATIGKKSDFNHSVIADLMTKYMGAILSKDAQDEVKHYMESPEDMGIDFRQPIYIFKTTNQCVGITMKMYDKGDFEDFLDLLRKQNLASKAVERDDVMTGTLLDDIEYGYDGNTILFLASLGEGGSPIGKQTLAALFKQSEDESFVSTESYDELTDMKGSDLVMFSNMAALPDGIAMQLKSLIPNGVRFTDVEFLASADFKDGKMDLDAKLVGTNDKAKKMLKEGDKNFHKIEGRYTNMPTSDFLAWGCMGVKGEWLLDKMKQDNELKQKLFLIERGIDIEAMLKAVDGDVAVMFPTSFISNDDAESMDFMTCGQLKNDKFLEDVDYWKQSMKEYGITMEKTGKNEYLVSSSDFKINWGVNDDDLYIGANGAFNAMANGKKTDVLNDRKDDIKDCEAYIYINLSALPMKELGKLTGFPIITHAFGKLQAFVLKFRSVDDMEFSIELNSDKDNFLKALL